MSERFTLTTWSFYLSLVIGAQRVTIEDALLALLGRRHPCHLKCLQSRNAPKRIAL